MFADPEHQAVADLLGAYALDAVDPEEVRLVEEHLARCPRCREEVDQLREVSAALGTTWEEPPPGVWDRIASGIAHHGALGDAAGSSRGATVDRLATAPPSPRPVPAPTDRRPPTEVARFPRRAWAATMAAAAAVAAIVVLAVSLVGANGRVGELQSPGGAPRAALHAALASPGHRLVSLQAPGGRHVAKLVIERDGTGYVVASSMASLPASETYQLWASIDGQPISLGLLGHRVSVGAAFSLGSTARAHELLVTVEPANGVVAPSRPPVASAALPDV